MNSSQTGTSETEPPEGNPIAHLQSVVEQTIATAGPVEMARMLRGFGNIQELVARHGDAQSDADAFYALAWAHAAFELGSFVNAFGSTVRDAIMRPPAEPFDAKETPTNAEGKSVRPADGDLAPVPPPVAPPPTESSQTGTTSEELAEIAAGYGFGIPHPARSGE